MCVCMMGCYIVKENKKKKVTVRDGCGPMRASYVFVYGFEVHKGV